MSRHYGSAIIGAGLACFGAAALAGNLGILATLPFASPTLSSLAILLGGVALLFAQARGSIQRAGQITLGIGLLSIAVLSRLDIDGAKISVGEGFAIALMGLTLVMFYIRQLASGLIQFLLIAMVIVGLFGLVGNSLNLAVFYSGYADIHIAGLSSLALLAYAVGLWIQSHEMTWHQRFYADRDDKKITLISGAILLGIALSAGLAGFVLMAKTTQTVLTDNLMISLEHRMRALQASIDNGIETTRLASTRPRFNALLAKHAQEGMNDAEHQEIHKILDDIIKNTPIRALIVYDARGNILGKRGQLIDSPAFQAPLGGTNGASLLWKEVTVLRAQTPIVPKGNPIGLLVVDIPLSAIDGLFRDFAGLGKSGSMGVCAAKGDRILCLPGRGNNYQVKLIPRGFNGQPVPMSFALDGKTGVVTAIDRNGENVISAHAPVGKLGLGMIVKINTAELYLAVKQQLGYTLGAIVIFVIIGMVLLRWQITPLARNLVVEIRERKLAEERFSHLAHHDSLTGLPNRVLFHDRMQLAMIDAKRRHQWIAIMFLDADRFKTVNDTLGHEAGDELLILIAARLSACLRAGDTIARLAGDEFALALPGMENTNDVRQLAQRLSDSFSGSFEIKEQQIFITASIGVTLYPVDASTIEGLLKNADTAMYRAKDAGRNNFQFYSADMHEQTLKRATLENRLRGAITRGELMLHYQPLVDVKSGQITGMEALLRWNHPELGLVPPMEFIPLAEDTGLIISIGEWVLRTACAQTCAWQEAGLPPLRLAVNLSARQFQKNLVDTVASILKDTGLEPRYLELELTETVVMQNPEMAVATLDTLDQMGVRLSIDDFGTGYSSLSYLKRFPIDTLKIDRSFVRDIPGSADDKVITTAIINLAHSLGIQVVAEGVESLAQLTFLQDQHCDVMQGYYFSKPLSVEAFEQLMREHSSGRPGTLETDWCM